MSGPLPGSWVDPEIVEAEPWLSHDGIVKFFEFPVRIPQMSRRAFHLYWQRHHSPNVMNVTGFAQFMRKYNSGHILLEPSPRLPQHYSQDHPFEGAAEVWLNRWQEVRDWLAHPLYAELVQPDEPRFIAQDGRNIIVITKEERLYEPERDMAENGKIKLYLLLSRKAGIEAGAFHKLLSNHGKTILAQPALRMMLRKFVISHRLREPSPLSDIPTSDVDAVAEFWFDRRDDIAVFFSHREYVESILRKEMEFCDTGKTRAIAAKMRVVHDEFSFQPSTTQPLPFDWNG